MRLPFCVACGTRHGFQHYPMIHGRRGGNAVISLCPRCRAGLVTTPPKKKRLLGDTRLKQEARMRGVATRQAQADAFARSLTGVLAELETEGIVTARAQARALNERGVATARGSRWSPNTVLAVRYRLLRLGLPDVVGAQKDGQDRSRARTNA